MGAQIRYGVIVSDKYALFNANFQKLLDKITNFLNI